MRELTAIHQALLSTTDQRLPLHDWRPAVKHKHGTNAIVEQLEDAPQEAKYVSVVQCSAFLVAHGHAKVVEPDARVDGQSLALQRLDSAQQRGTRVSRVYALSMYVHYSLNGPGAWLKQ